MYIGIGISITKPQKVSAPVPSGSFLLLEGSGYLLLELTEESYIILE